MVESVPATREQLPDPRDTASRFQQVMSRQGYDPWTALSNMLGNVATAPFQGGRQPAGATFDSEDSTELNMPPSTRPPQARRSAVEEQLPMYRGVPSWTERQQQLAQHRTHVAQALEERRRREARDRIWAERERLRAARDLAASFNITPQQLFSTLGIAAPNITFGQETFRQPAQPDIPTPPEYVPPTPEQLRRMDAARTSVRPQAQAAARPSPVDPRFAARLARILGETSVGPSPYATSVGTPVEAPAPASRSGPGLILDPMMGGGNA